MKTRTASLPAALAVLALAIGAPAAADVTGLAVYGRVIGISYPFDAAGTCRLLLDHDGTQPTTIDLIGRLARSCEPGGIHSGQWLLIPASSRSIICGGDVCSIFVAVSKPVIP